MLFLFFSPTFLLSFRTLLILSRISSDTVSMQSVQMMRYCLLIAAASEGIRRLISSKRFLAFPINSDFVAGGARALGIPRMAAVSIAMIPAMQL
jgi:hypothetical protein